MRFSLHSFAVLLIVLSGHAEGAEEPLTIADVKSAYQQNFLGLLPFRVVWNQIKVNQAIGKFEAGLEIQAVDALLERPTLPDDLKNELIRNRRIAQQASTGDGATVKHVTDFRTDGRGYQIRSPIGRHLPSEFTFPESPISAEELLSTYQKINIASWQPDDSERKYRRWGGLLTSDTPVGVVGDTADDPSPHQFPPIGFVHPEWGSGEVWHAMDRFMSRPPETLKLVGDENLNGRPLLRLEYRKVLQTTVSNTSNGPVDIEQEEFATGWLDRTQGYLPMRISEGKRYRYGGKVLNETKQDPDLITEVTKVARFSGSYYPMEGRAQYFKTDPTIRFTPPDLSQFIAGAQFQFPRVVVSSETWLVERLSPRLEINAMALNLSFPKGTRYYDKHLQRPMIAGMTVEEFDRQVAEKYPKPSTAETGGVRWSIIILNIVLLLALGGFVIGRRAIRQRVPR